MTDESTPWATGLTVVGFVAAVTAVAVVVLSLGLIRVHPMLAVLTGAGLSAAAGLNAYIPFLLVGLLARFTDVITLPGEWQWIESWWALGIGTVLLISELVLDKIPVVVGRSNGRVTAVTSSKLKAGMKVVTGIKAKAKK